MEEEAERDIDLLNRDKEPKLSAIERGRLKTCEGPCTEEEWRSVSTKIHWGTMDSLGLLRKREENDIKGEQEIPGPPKEAKSLPPMPPSTFLKDKPRNEQNLGSIDEGTDEVTVGGGKGDHRKGSKGGVYAKGK